MAAVNTPISGYTNTNEIAAAINGTSSNVKEPKKPIARTHRGSGHLRCITHRTAECHNLRKQSANEQSVSSSSVSVLRERKPSDNLCIVKPSMHSLPLLVEVLGLEDRPDGRLLLLELDVLGPLDADGAGVEKVVSN